MAQIKPNGFQLAQQHLLRQGFTCFGPTQRERRHLAQLQKSKQVVRPLFPGYLFVQFSADQPGWQSINSTRGVSRLLLQGRNKLQALPSPFMAGLLARCDEAGILIETEDFKPGDRVRLLSGPFADFVTTVESFESQERLRVLFDLMGREIRVSVPAVSVARSQ
ncbi:transcription termination/antitermination protein NusG [Pseudophaeobacter sp. TrK17]|uniref:transcription termination/antitermination protein NusG n=1 Tax=Pseudophaeobacter sp. TrK17 TaxID=2815167 RepID=UPI0035D12BB2